jgi:hypothetical protein
MSFFTIDFIIVNIIIALVVSVIANILSNYLINNKNNLYNFLKKINLQLFGGILFFLGMFLGMGVSILINENIISKQFSYMPMMGMGIFSIGLAILSFAMLMKANERNLGLYNKIYAFGGFILSITILINLPVFGKFS